MSNNAAVTPEGGEIGRAQALQARAAGRQPHTDMNPVLLKPESETGAQIIVQGQAHRQHGARAPTPTKRPALMRPVLESFRRLAHTPIWCWSRAQAVPPRSTCAKGDIANMGFAEAAGVPVILIGDIDRGGVIAQIVGTQAVLARGRCRADQGFRHQQVPRRSQPV